MAAAVIPLAMSLLPTAIPLVVRLVEQLVGPKNGAVKQDLASQILEALQNAWSTAKVSEGKPLSTDQIKLLIDSAVVEMNSRGELKGRATAIDTTLAGVRRRLADVAAVLDVLEKP